MPSFYYKFLTKKNITNYAISIVAVAVVVVVFFIHKWTDESVLHLYHPELKWISSIIWTNECVLIEQFIPVWV